MEERCRKAGSHGVHSEGAGTAAEGEPGSPGCERPVAPGIEATATSSSAVSTCHQDQHESFKTCRLTQFVHEWDKLTSDTFIIDMVRGSEILISEFANLQADSIPSNRETNERKWMQKLKTC